MKKRLLAILLTACMLMIALSAMAMATDTATSATMPAMATASASTDVAAIGSQKYPTLVDAVNAALTQPQPVEIKVLANSSGAGIFVGAGSANMTIDFGGHTYTCNGPAVGSSGTESQAFHLEEGNTITLKNGKITSTSGSGVLMLVQNYCNLTVDSIELDGTKLGTGKYTMSNNCGNVKITGSTKIIAPEEGVAFDVYSFSPYTGANVTVDGNVTIEGKIEVDYDTGASISDLALTINSGTINGDVSVVPSDSTLKEKVTITGGTFSEDVSEYAKNGYSAVEKNGKYVVATTTEDNSSIAKVDNLYFTTIQGAIDAADADHPVVLQADVTLDNTVVINKDVTLDLNQKTLTSANSYALKVLGGNVAIKNGSIAGAYGVSAYAGVLTLEGANIDTTMTAIANYDASTVTIDKDSVVNSTNYAAIVIWGDGFGENAKKPTLNVYGTVKNESAYGTITGNGTDKSGTTINIFEGASVTAANSIAIYNPQPGTVTVSGGTIEGASAIGIKSGTLNITGGTLKGNGTYAEVTTNSNGINSDGAAIMVDSNTAYAGILNITVSGNAILSSENSYAIHEISADDSTNIVSLEIKDGALTGADDKAAVLVQTQTNDNVTVKGGNFSHPVNKEYLDSSLKAELYSTAEYPDAPFSYYKSVTDAETADPTGVVKDLTQSSTGTTEYKLTLNYGYEGKTVALSGVKFTLPTPTRPGYTFSGWSDGTTTYKAGDTVTLTDNTIYTAQWTEIPVVPTYTVTAPANVDNGKVTVSPKNAVKNSTVTITATPDEGYELSDLTVTDASGKELELTDLGGGKYSFKMPGSKVTVSATFTKADDEKDPIQDCPQDATCPAVAFDDIASGAWYHDGVHYCVAEKLMNGVGDNKFDPNGNLSRAMLVTVLYRLEGSPEAGAPTFTDVPANQWYSAAVAWAAENQIVNGVGDNRYAPNEDISRQDMATILHRYAKFKGYDMTKLDTLAAYSDADSIASYAKEPFQWCVANGIINGMTSSTIVPKGNATRAEVATVLMRYCENIAK